MNKSFVYKLLRLLIACVWLVNGLYCKVLNGVPRHREIVGEILGEAYATPLTILIGLSEIVMAIWVLSEYKSRFNTLCQIGLVAVMNILEFILIPELLLWGRINSIFALGFIGLLYYHGFILKKEIADDYTA